MSASSPAPEAYPTLPRSSSLPSGVARAHHRPGTATLGPAGAGGEAVPVLRRSPSGYHHHSRTDTSSTASATASTSAAAPNPPSRAPSRTTSRPDRSGTVSGTAPSEELASSPAVPPLPTPTASSHQKDASSSAAPAPHSSKRSDPSRSYYSRPVPRLPSATVPRAPPAALYWSRAPVWGQMPGRGLRAHSATVVVEGGGGSTWHGGGTAGTAGKVFVFGGCDPKNCWKDVWCLDAETWHWTKPRVSGTIPPPLRAHSATLVDRRLWIFGGGDGSMYSNDLYWLDTLSMIWTKASPSGDAPSKRRAHAACLWTENRIVIFGGGNGAKALNDVHVLDVSDPARPHWSPLSTVGTPPGRRGYHTANLVNGKLVVYGGSDGHECFGDVHVLDLDTHDSPTGAATWIPINVRDSWPRLAHTSTQIGSYLFIFGGHDGVKYNDNVLLFNLVTLQWESRRPYGKLPAKRGYHACVLYDSRLILIGGFDGHQVFDDVHILDLAAFAYVPQITNFTLPLPI